MGWGEAGWGRPSCLLPLILIDLIPKAHSIHDGQLELHIALLEVVGLGPEAHTLLVVTSFLSLEGRVEECVHQCGLADASLPWEAGMRGEGMSEAATGAVPGCWLGWAGLRHPQLPQKREGRASHCIPHCPCPQEPSLFSGFRNNVWKEKSKG